MNWILIDMTAKPKMIIFDWNGTLVYNNKQNIVCLMANAINVLKKLEELGILVSIISNSSMSFLERTIKRYKLEKYFLNVIGTRGEFDYKKPSKEVVEYALIGSDIKNMNKYDIWIVGDSIGDIETAYNSNIRPVIFGYKLLNEVLAKEGIKPNSGCIYFRDYADFLKMLEKF